MARHASPHFVHRASWLVLSCALGAALPGCSAEPSPETTSDELGFDEVVYVVRQHTVVRDDGDVRIDVAGGMGQVMDHGRYVPGGRIEVLNLATLDRRNLLEGDRFRNADIDGLDVSFDAKKIVFSMKLSGDDNYHVYTANLTRGEDSENPYGIRQLTGPAPYDDIHPIWVAGGRIAFVTTQPYTEMGRRADEYNHSRQVPQIGTVTEAGGDADRKVCSQNLSNTFNLFSMQSGQIGFSRWEHLENVNDSKLFAMNPDCTQMIALSGQHGKNGFNSLVQVVESQDRNVFYGIGTNRENTIQGGALIRVDARTDVEGLHDEERADVTSLTPTVPKGEEPSAIGRYRTPVQLPDGRLLVSWSDGAVNELNEIALTPPDWGLYVYDPETRTNQLVYNDEDTWEIDAQPIVARDEPPVLSSIQNSQDATTPMLLGSIDVRQTSLGFLHGNVVSGAQFTDTPIEEALGHAVKVRIIEGFSTEAAPQATMFGLTMAEGAAILGEATIDADGSWLASVPPFVPYHLQPVDEFELAIRNQTTWIQGMPGEARVCGGCHEERTGPNRPSFQQLPAANTAEDLMFPIAERAEYPWYGADAAVGTGGMEIQSILTEKCADCHNSETNGGAAQTYYSLTMTDAESGATTSYDIPRLDLSTTPITVTYDMDVVTYPASYVSIFYPSALAMEMGMGVTVDGDVPPAWGVPSDARNSALIEKINITSVYGNGTTAWPLDEPFSDDRIAGGTRTMHPEDVGVTLTRDERAALIRAIDLGGQYYSRQNGGFVPDLNDSLVTTGREY